MITIVIDFKYLLLQLVFFIIAPSVGMRMHIGTYYYIAMYVLSCIPFVACVLPQWPLAPTVDQNTMSLHYTKLTLC